MAVALVQAVGSGAPSAGSESITFPSAPTPGNILLFGISYRGGDTITPPSGVTQIAGPFVRGGAGLRIYSRTVASGDGSTWGFSTSADYISMTAMELSGQDTGTLLANVPSSTNTNTGSLTSPSATGVADGYAVAFLATNMNVTNPFTVSGTGWSKAAEAVGFWHAAAAAGKAGLTTASTTGAAFSWSPSGDTVASTLIVRPAPVPTAPPAAPTNFAITPADTSALASWAASNGATSYEVEWEEVILGWPEDVWNGSALIRYRTDVWNGTALVQEVTEP